MTVQCMAQAGQRSDARLPTALPSCPPLPTPADGRGRRAALLLQHMPVSSGGSRLAALPKLWTGVGATLARDVPFSALYWGMVEPIRTSLLPRDGHHVGEWQVFTANVTGAPGGGAGRAGPGGGRACAGMRLLDLHGVCMLAALVLLLLLHLAASMHAAACSAPSLTLFPAPCLPAPCRSRRGVGRPGGRHHHPL